MTDLVYSDALRRKIRSGRLSSLGISTWTLIREAVQAGRTQEALDLVDYLNPEGKALHDSYCDWVYADLTFIAENLGEEYVYRAIRYGGEVLAKSAVVARIDDRLGREVSIEEILAQRAETMRSHRCGPGENGDFIITEDEEKFILTFDPCGSGGRMRRAGTLDKLPPRTDPPYNLGRTSKPYFWSWSKANVPYYCSHCCVWQEIVPIEQIGYPLRINDYKDDPEAPCSWLFYKDPALIPEQYFTRIGKTKDINRFVR